MHREFKMIKREREKSIAYLYPIQAGRDTKERVVKARGLVLIREKGLDLRRHLNSPSSSYPLSFFFNQETNLRCTTPLQERFVTIVFYINTSPAKDTKKERKQGR